MDVILLLDVICIDGFIRIEVYFKFIDSYLYLLFVSVYFKYVFIVIFFGVVLWLCRNCLRLNFLEGRILEYKNYFIFKIGWIIIFFLILGLIY